MMPRMLEPALKEALAGLKEAGIDFVSGLPDGWQRNLHEAIAADPDMRYVPVCNEGVGFSICAGAWCARSPPRRTDSSRASSARAGTRRPRRVT